MGNGPLRPGPTRKVIRLRPFRRLLNSPLALRVAEVLVRRSENRMTAFGMLAQAFEFVKINGIGGDYLEFGVWRGTTFHHARTMARRYRVPGVKFRAFDSFQGLPPVAANKYEIWREGQFACGREEFEAELKRKGFRPGEYVVTEGFYADSLSDGLVAALKSEGMRAAVTYIDCDLYESTRDVLRFLAHFLQDGTVVCFDDYWNYRGRSDMGEQRALAEFAAAHPEMHLRPYLAYSPTGMSFLCEFRRAET